MAYIINELTGGWYYWLFHKNICSYWKLLNKAHEIIYLLLLDIPDGAPKCPITGSVIGHRSTTLEFIP